MIEGEHELRAPRSDDEWRAFHDIRRKVLFENRGEFDRYDENHPDDSKEGNYPLVLIYKGVVVGVVRVDVCEQVSWLRRVAIREDLHRLGHGRVLLQLAESLAKGAGCKEVRTNAAMDAIEFYERCGYAREAGELKSAMLRKSLE
jgi:GNAT superfamily N-acetyltransferase